MAVGGSGGTSTSSRDRYPTKRVDAIYPELRFFIETREDNGVFARCSVLGVEDTKRDRWKATGDGGRDGLVGILGIPKRGRVTRRVVDDF